MSERRLDVDALLQDTSLVVTIGGAEYRLTDMPVAAAMRVEEPSNLSPEEKQRAAVERDLQFLKDVLGATCGEEGQRAKLFADLKGLGQRGRHALVLSLLDFSDASDLLDRLPIRDRLKEAIKTGLGQSPTTSTSTTSPGTTPE